MTVTVETSKHLGVARGQNRVVFRNPRGLKRYYSLYISDGVLLSPQASVRAEYSVDGIDWSGGSNTTMFWSGVYDVSVGEVHAFDVKIRDTGSRLEIFVAGIGYNSLTSDYQLKYCRGVLSDSASAIAWDTADTITNVNDEGISGAEYCTALARTDNGELVVAFTEQYRDMGKSYVLTKLVGSDGDGAAPNWSGTITWDDPSGSTNNQNKDGVWFGLETTSGDSVYLFSRVPELTTTSNYEVIASSPSWGGTVFNIGTIKRNISSHGADSGKILSGLIDLSGFRHLLYYDHSSASLIHKKGTAAGGPVSTDVHTVFSGDCDACTMAVVTEGPPAQIPTSDEATGTWSSTDPSLYGAVDNGYNVLDTRYISTNSSSDTCRIGGFSGGIAPIIVRGRWLIEASSISVATYLDGVFVETVDASLGLDAIFGNNSMTPTDPDWNEIQLTADPGLGATVYVSNVTVDARELVVFYHQAGDTVDFNYKTAYMAEHSAEFTFSSEKVVSYHEDITGLSSWSESVEGSIHIAGQFGTTIIYNEHPTYKALSTTLADMEFPDQNYYLGPHST